MGGVYELACEYFSTNSDPSSRPWTCGACRMLAGDGTCDKAGLREEGTEFPLPFGGTLLAETRRKASAV